MSAHLSELLQAFDGNLPLAKARTIPSSWYWHPEMYALESRKVFGAAWQFVGRAEQVQQAGLVFDCGDCRRADPGSARRTAGC